MKKLSAKEVTQAFADALDKKLAVRGQKTFRVEVELPRTPANAMTRMSVGIFCRSFVGDLEKAGGQYREFYGGVNHSGNRDDEFEFLGTVLVQMDIPYDYERIDELLESIREHNKLYDAEIARITKEIDDFDRYVPPYDFYEDEENEEEYYQAIPMGKL